MWIGPENHRVVGEVLEAARKKTDFTQMELAKLLTKPQSFVSTYEAGQRRIDLLEFAKIAEVLGADPKALATKVFNSLRQARLSKSRR